MDYIIVFDDLLNTLYYWKDYNVVPELEYCGELMNKGEIIGYVINCGGWIIDTYMGDIRNKGGSRREDLPEDLKEFIVDYYTIPF